MSGDLRCAVEAHAGGPLYFITLTQRHGPTPATREAARSAWRRLQRAWERLRKSHAMRVGVVGGIKVVECTYGRKVRGWHPHLHLLVELVDDAHSLPCPTCEGTRRHAGAGCRSCGSRTHQSDGTVPAWGRKLVEAWCAVSDALPQGQCCVPLDHTNVGQLAKYLTKLWELDSNIARELFAAAEGRRLVDGWGAWRGWRRAGDEVEQTPHGWFSSGLGVQQLEAMAPDTPVYFGAHVGTLYAVPYLERGATRRAIPDAARLDLDALRRSKHLQGKRPLRESSTPQPTAWGSARDVVAHHNVSMVVGMMTARDVLAALRRDPRPVWERVDEKPPDHAERTARVRAAIAAERREACRGHTLRKSTCATAPPMVDW